MILTQTGTIFLDAYRELNAKKLFWITMALNLLAVCAFAALGINERGVTFLHWTFDFPFFNTSTISKRLFYITTFTGAGVAFWLSWVTTILALVSTAGIIPDMISGGTIEAILSKPIGRVRYFLTKYLSALLFVAMQVAVFTLGAFFVLGIRGGAWEPGLLLAIPIVLAFFSFLYSFCALIGLLTRSPIASLLLTLLFWCFIFILNTGDSVMVTQRERSILQLEDRRQALQQQVRFAESKLELMRREGKPIPGEDAPLPPETESTLDAVHPLLRQARERQEKAEQSVQTWTSWARRVFVVKTVLPKTQETIALLDRHLISNDELKTLLEQQERNGSAPPDDENDLAMNDPRISARVQEIFRERSIGWVLGTSFLFEGVLLTICCWVFARRDF